MVSFRPPKKQATYALKPRVAIGTSRHKAKMEGRGDLLIHSYGTLRNYTQALSTCAQWYSEQAHLGRDGFDGQVKDISFEQAREYLRHRSTLVGQKQIDLDRQALENMLGCRLGRLKSLAESPDRLATRPRAYSEKEAALVAMHQSPANALATWIAADAGLRGHELFTLATLEEQPPSQHRTFSTARFAGRSDFRRYTVAGKGGLVREVAISNALAERLDQARMNEPHGVRDRGIWYQQRYRTAGGQRWSESFGAASIRALGWSAGAHGLRHSYAQSRLETLQVAGFSWNDALQIVSEELGHFRRSVTLSYLR